MEKRKEVRHDKVEKLKGKLYSFVNFKVKNISRKGLRLVCGFIIKVGTVYSIYLNKNEKKKDFKIKIVRAEACPFDEKYIDLYSDGILYEIGAEFIDLNKERKEFLENIINEENDFDESYFVE